MFDSLTLLFLVASTSQTGYTPQRQGWISGWDCSIGTQFMIGVGTDLPTVAYSANGVYPGVYLTGNQSISSAATILPTLRARFEAGQIINVRNLSASQMQLRLYLLFPVT